MYTDTNHHRDSVWALSFLSYSSRLGMQERLTGFRHVSFVGKTVFLQFQRETQVSRAMARISESTCKTSAINYLQNN